MGVGELHYKAKPCRISWEVIYASVDSCPYTKTKESLFCLRIEKHLAVLMKPQKQLVALHKLYRSVSRSV